MAPTNLDIEVEVDIHASTTHTYRSRQTHTGASLANTSQHDPGSFTDNDEDLERALRESAAQAEEDEAQVLQRLLDESRAEAERAAAVDEAAELAAALARSQLDALTEEEAQMQQLLQQSRAEFFNSQKAQGVVTDDDEALMDAVKKRSVEDWHKCTWDQKPPGEENWSNGSGSTREEKFHTTTSYTHRSAAKGVGIGTMGFAPGTGMVPAAHALHPYALSGPGGYAGPPFGGGGGQWPPFPPSAPHGPIPGAHSVPTRLGAAPVPTAWTQATHVSHRHDTQPSSTATMPSPTPSAPRTTGTASLPDRFESSVGKGCHSAVGLVANTVRTFTKNSPRPGTATPAVTVCSFGEQSGRSTPQPPASASPIPHPVPPVDDPNLVHVLPLDAEDSSPKEGLKDPMDMLKQGDQKSERNGSVDDKESTVNYRKEYFKELKKLVQMEKDDADAGGKVEGSVGGDKAREDERDGTEDDDEPDDPEFVKEKRLAFLNGLSK